MTRSLIPFTILILLATACAGIPDVNGSLAAAPTPAPTATSAPTPLPPPPKVSPLRPTLSLSPSPARRGAGGEVIIAARATKIAQLVGDFDR